MAVAYVRGYQGPHLDDPQSMLACVKHFVGYGAAEAGRDYNAVDISDRTVDTHIRRLRTKLGDHEGHLVCHEARDEMHIAAEPVQFSDSDWATVVAGLGEGLGELGTSIQRVGALSGLDFYKLLDNLQALR